MKIQLPLEKIFNQLLGSHDPHVHLIIRALVFDLNFVLQNLTSPFLECCRLCIIKMCTGTGKPGTKTRNSLELSKHNKVKSAISLLYTNLQHCKCTITWAIEVVHALVISHCITVGLYHCMTLYIFHEVMVNVQKKKAVLIYYALVNGHYTYIYNYTFYILQSGQHSS